VVEPSRGPANHSAASESDRRLVVSSYLADQCWSGGRIYLIMLRRVKRQAPPPPCNANAAAGGRAEDPPRCGAASAPPANGKRTRKVGVISRSSSNRDSGLKSSHHGCNGSAPAAEGAPPGGGGPPRGGGLPGGGGPGGVHSPAASPLGRTAPQRLRGVTLPTRCHSQLLECSMESFSSESSSLVRPGGRGSAPYSREGEPAHVWSHRYHALRLQEAKMATATEPNSRLHNQRASS